MSKDKRKLAAAAAAAVGYYGDGLGLWQGDHAKAGGAGASKQQRWTMAAIFGVAAYAILSA